MSGYSITNNPPNFSEKPMYAKTAPNFEANTIALNTLNINKGWEIKPVATQLNISYNGQSVFNIPSSTWTPNVPSIKFILNGKLVTVYNPNPDQTVLSYLRQNTNYSGTKQGCVQGGCGVCTVMLSFVDSKGILKNVSVNSCLTKLVACNNYAITTIEALGNTTSGNLSLHPIQLHFAKIGGFQCGFCTSGQIMNIYSAFQTQSGQSNNGMKPLWDKTEFNQANNLCRCTGYRPIIEAYKALMTISQTVQPGNPYAPNPSENTALWNKWKAPVGPNAAAVQLPIYSPLNDKANALNYKTQFPSMLNAPTGTNAFVNTDNNNMYYSVGTLDSLKSVVIDQILAGKGSNIQIVQGQSSYGVPGYRRPANKSIVVNIQNIPEMYQVVQSGNVLTFGAGLRISELADYLSASSVQVYQALAKHINYISGWQNRNLGSWIGGIMMAKEQGFSSDMALIMLACGIVVNLLVFSSNGTVAEESIDLESFLAKSYTGQVVVVKSAVLTTVPNQQLYTYRTAMRIYNARAVAHMAWSVVVNGNVITNPVIYIGAVFNNSSATNKGFLRWTQAEQYLAATPVSALNANVLIGYINTSIKPLIIPNLVHGTTLQQEIEYRTQLLDGYCLQFVGVLQGSTVQTQLVKPTVWGTQEYGTPAGVFDSVYQTKLNPNSVHLNNYKQLKADKTSGEAKYVYDLIPNNCLHLQTVAGGSPDAKWFPKDPTEQKGYGAVPYQEIDMDAPSYVSALATARNMAGVQLIVTPKDIYMNENYIGYVPLSSPSGGYSPMFLESVFPVVAYLNGTFSGGPLPPPVDAWGGLVQRLNAVITSIGQVFALVVATTQEQAFSAAGYLQSQLVYKVPVTPVLPVIETKIASSYTQTSALNQASSSIYPRMNQFMFGPALDGPSAWGNIDGTDVKPTPGAIAAYPGIVGDFDTQFPVAQYKATGALTSGSMDHFPMERYVNCVIPKDGMYEIISNTQVGYGFYDNLNFAFTYGNKKWTADPSGLPIWYSTSGPLRAPDGGLFYDKSKVIIRTPYLGGAFGGKFRSYEAGIYVYIAARLLNRPVVHNQTYSNGMLMQGGNGSTQYSYDLGFNSSGKVTALRMLTNWDQGLWKIISGYPYNGGFCTNALGLGMADSSRNLATVYNWGAFKNNTICTTSNKSLCFSTRSFRQAEGFYSIGAMLQQVSHALGSSFFDVMVTNLISKESPFKDTTTVQPDGSTGTIINNFGIDQVFSTAQGYYSQGETKYEPLIQAIDRKVNALYGYATVPNYTGVAYNNTNARYPAIKRLEQDVAVFNALPQNKYIKRGVAVFCTSYHATQGWNVSINLQVQLLKNCQLMIKYPGNDGGQGASSKMLLTFANEFWLSPDRFTVISEPSQTSSAGLGHGGSVLQGHLQRAAILAAQDWFNKAFDAIYFDLTQGYFSSNFYQLVNVIPVNGTSNPPVSGLPTTADLAWIKSDASGKDLKMLTLVRYAQQSKTYTWPGGVTTNAQKGAIIDANWEAICAGLLGQAPKVFNSVVPGGIPIMAPSWGFGASIRDMIGLGSSSYSPFNPLFFPGVVGQGDIAANWRINACVLSLVEINTLTGENNELQAILCVDLGQSADPLNDIMQMEGAYYFGKAYMIHEEKYFDKTTGELLNPDTWDYKPGCSGNTPVNWSVLMLNDPSTISDPANGTFAEVPVAPGVFLPTLGTVNKNKPISEILTPGAATMNFALRNAISAYRDQQNLDPVPSIANTMQRNAWMDSIANFPLTINKIKLCCPLPNVV